MFTITFDESAGFEKYMDDSNSIPLLGGFIYDHGHDKSFELDNGARIAPERVRIIEYLKAVCNSGRTDFPVDLHCNRNNTNGEKVTRTKTEIKRSLPEFIVKGTYKGKELVYVADDKYSNNRIDNAMKRHGTYHIVTLLMGESTQARDSFYRDGIASNTYLGMVEDMILKTGFLNLDTIPNDSEVEFDVPTRVVPNPENRRIREEYKRLGYRYDKGLNQWCVTEPGDIKQIIRHASEEIGRIRITSINTTSIGIGYKNKADSIYDFAFLFLSDIICDFINEKAEVMPKEKKAEMLRDIKELKRRNSDNKIIERIIALQKKIEQDKFIRKSDIPSTSKVKNEEDRQLLKKWKSFFPKNAGENSVALMKIINSSDRNLLFYYGDAGNCYNDALRALIKGDLFDSLSSVYDGRSLKKSEAVEYYIRTKLPFVEQMAKECSLFELRDFIKKTDSYRFSTNLRQHKLIYLYRQMLNIAIDKDISRVDMYKIQDIGISAYTHIGDYENAKKCFEECKSIKDEGYIDDTTFKRTIKRRISGLIDAFDFVHAEDEAICLLPADWADEIRTNRTETENSLFRALNIDDCKTLSSLGQIYAQMGDKRAKKCFLSALQSLKEMMEYDNYYITLSFFLHYLIDQKEIGEYEKHAKEYFGGRIELGDQLDYIIQEATKDESTREHASFSFGFAMYVFIKAYYMFYVGNSDNQEVTKALANVQELVRKIDDSANAEEKWVSGHPWELVLKYAAFIELLITESIINSKMLMDCASRSVEDASELIVDRITRFGYIEYYKKVIQIGGGAKYTESYNKAVNSLYNELAEIINLDEKNSLDDKYNSLSDIFHYMYR